MHFTSSLFGFLLQLLGFRFLFFVAPMGFVGGLGLTPFDLVGVQVQPIRLYHGKLPVLGFRFGDVAFCIDVSHIPDESWPLLQNLDTIAYGLCESFEIFKPGINQLAT